MTHLINDLGTLSMSSLKRCLAVAGIVDATSVSTLPASECPTRGDGNLSGDFNELTDLAKTPQADCERMLLSVRVSLGCFPYLIGT